MGFKDFFKKFIKDKSKKSEPQALVEISFNKVNTWIEDKEIEVKSKEEKIILDIKYKISESIKELDKKINILEQINIDSIKSQEKIKLVVKENLKKYLEEVNKFKNNIIGLSNTKENRKNLNEFFINLNLIFHDFEKKSRMNYEKSTILIGKEMADVRETIKNLYDYLKLIFQGNKEIIHNLNHISIIKENIEKNTKIENFISDLEKKHTLLDTKLDNIKKENSKITEEIESFKKSKEYSEILKIKQEIKNKQANMEREIFNIKGLIDFKRLGNIFHSDDKKMQIVKSHKDNFNENFNKDCGKRLLDLLIESRTDKEVILKINEKISEIKKQKTLIDEMNNKLNNDKLNEMHSKIEKNNIEIKNIDSEKEKILKNIEKIRDKQKDILEEIKKKSEKLGAVVKVN